MMAPPEAGIASFSPHLLVHDAEARSGSAPLAEAGLEGVPYRLEISYAHGGGMDARLHADGRTIEVPDASTEGLLGAVDAARIAGRTGAMPTNAQEEMDPSANVGSSGL